MLKLKFIHDISSPPRLLSDDNTPNNILFYIRKYLRPTNIYCSVGGHIRPELDVSTTVNYFKYYDVSTLSRGDIITITETYRKSISNVHYMKLRDNVVICVKSNTVSLDEVLEEMKAVSKMWLMGVE